VIGIDSAFGAIMGQDFWSFDFPSGFLSFPLPPIGTTTILLAFQDASATRISDSQNFFVNTSLDGWDLGFFSISGQTALGPQRLAGGFITELTVIPEPSTALLMGLGLVALGVRRPASGTA
jgi:hypothetical protein